jgi:hypothetical protein
MESKLNRRFGPELKYKIQSKFPMTNRLHLFNHQNLNLQATIPFEFLVLLFDYLTFSSKDTERVPMFGRFPTFFPQNKIFAAFFFWGGGVFLFEFISCQYIMSFNNCDLFQYN